MSEEKPVDLGVPTPPQPMATPTMVRSRPKLPTIRDEESLDMTGSRSSGQLFGEDLVGVLNSLGTTDFVRKYSRRGRTSATSSPTTSLPSSTPTSPRSGHARSSASQSSAAVTLRRMRSIKLELEKVQARENARSESIVSALATLPRRKMGTFEAPMSAENMFSSSKDTNIVTESEQHACPPKEKVSFSPVVSSTQCHVSPLVSPTTSTAKVKTKNPKIGSAFSSRSTPGCRSQPKDRSLARVKSLGSFDRESQSSFEATDEDHYDSKTGDELSDSSLGPSIRPKLNRECSFDAEDEGVGATDIEGPSFKDAYTAVVDGPSHTGIFKKVGDIPPSTLSANIAGNKQGVNFNLGDDPGIKRFQRLVEPGANVNGSPKLTSSGRFLTHPPSRERSNSKEIGSMDSNGLGSLREGTEHVADTDLTSQVSVISLDSHFCPSDTMETPSYRDVVMDITSEVMGAEKFERRNGRSFKQKSKSDPCGQKQKLTENVDLPTVVSAHAQSTPVLLEDKDKVTQMPEFQKTEGDKRKSMSDTVLSKEGTRVKEIKESDMFTLTSEDSSADELSQIKHGTRKSLVKHRRATKIRLSGSDDEQLGEGDHQDEVTVGDSPKRTSRRSSTAPSSPLSQSPDNTLDRCTKAKMASLTLPLSAKRQPVGRSHSSASVILHKKETLREPSARPKDLHWADGKGLKKRPPLHHPSGLQGKGATLSGGSVPELSTSSPKFRERSASSIVAPNYSPKLEPIFSGSTLSLLEGPAEDKEKRELIVKELVETERLYVETLQMLVERYMVPMKQNGILDSNLVDDIFYKVNEIYMHHATFLAFLERSWKHWDSNMTIGDVIYKNFSKETVIESYMSFIGNFPRAEKVLVVLATKSSFQKFVEQCERETRSKLPLKAQIVKPAQRIPRYELLLKRLLTHTPKDHPDYSLLLRAEGAIHKLALKINSTKESKQEGADGQQNLKKLELLLLTDLISPERLYVRFDMVQILNRKDQCCIWLFSDLAVFTSIKRKSGPVNRRTTLLIQSPVGNDFVENIKHKVWLKISLDDLEIIKTPNLLEKKKLVDREELEEDFTILGQISDLSNKLKCSHQNLDETIRELMNKVNKHLSEHQLKSPPPEANKVELVATTREGMVNLTIVFPTADKRALWESTMLDSKQKLATVMDGRPPEFLQALQITKTRAGMQFSCAAPIEGLNAKQFHDVWVCNSDGYVGHMCLLSLQPEPIVTLNTPVPGCNSRILSIYAVPAHLGFRRKPSCRKSTGSPPVVAIPPSITVEIHDDHEGEEASDSSSSVSDEEEFADTEETVDISEDNKRVPSPVITIEPPPSPSIPRVDSTVSIQSPKENPLHDPHKSTMWLGTEDGCIHVFLSTDNIKTTKNKVKIQHSAGVLCIVHMECRECKVFVSLANGDVIVYNRDQDYRWDVASPETITLGNATSPVTRMLPVAGKIWCSCNNEIRVVNPYTLRVEETFVGNPESKRNIQCMACSGQSVWVAGQGSSKVQLFHATTFEHLLDVSIAQAVAQKLQTADDIIRQHKTACLRITSLLTCKDLLWVGTSAGVVLTIPMPKISSTTTKASLVVPSATGLVHGHTGHVRFLTSVELPSQNRLSGNYQKSETSELNPLLSRIGRRGSIATHTRSLATKMLVISGGDGYEDFRSSSANEAAGRDDSTNHLLLWQV